MNMAGTHSHVLESQANSASSGGLEMLFSDKRQHKLAIPAHDKNDKAVTVAYLIEYLCQYTMKDKRKDLFVLDDHLYVSSPLFVNELTASAVENRLDTSTPFDTSVHTDPRPPVVQESLSSSTMQTGSSKERNRTRFKVVTTSCSSRRCMVARRSGLFSARSMFTIIIRQPQLQPLQQGKGGFLYQSTCSLSSSFSRTRACHTTTSTTQ